MKLPPEALAAPIEELLPARGGSLLDELALMAEKHEPWHGWAEQRGLLVEGDAVLVEVRFAAAPTGATEVALGGLGVRVHAQSVPTLMEVWVPATALAKVASLPGVLAVRPARLVSPSGRWLPSAGSVQSEGVAQSGLDPYHALGADGSGVILAVIDAGFQGWAARQASGDWPPSARLRRFEVSGGTVTDCDVGTCSTFEATQHGTATVEIAYDSAPGATFLVYKTQTIAEWYNALLHASDASLNGVGVADVISVSLGAPLDGVGDGSNCPPLWPAPCGTIAEAAGTARSRGSLVVNAAGNARIEHWGGLYTPSTGDADIHTWSGTNRQVNYIGTGSGSAYCISNGFLLTAELFWDDWTNVNHDYDLYLVEYTGSGWAARAQSTHDQNGGTGQSPQEYIAWTASSNYPAVCSPTSGIYGFYVRRFSASTNRNLQFFGPYDMDVRVPARSLGFPADSPNVVAAGALDVNNPSTQEYYSGEGPQLSPGGGLGAPTDPKLDLMSFARVSTATYGAGGFAGTSAPTPHVAGVAAVLTQLRNEKPVERGSQPPGLQRALELAASDGDNDLGASGHDTVFGYGRLRLRECSVAAEIQAGWNLVSLPCDRRTDNTPSGVFGSSLGTFNTDWAMWRYDASAGTYQRIWNATDPLELGEGYWLYRFTTPSPSPTFTGLVADRSEAYPRAVTGASGLGRPHLVGAPRTFSIPWNQVRFYYGGSEKSFAQAYTDGVVRNLMWTWNRATQQYEVFDGLLGEGVIQPGQGFWIRALQDVEVRLPAEVSGGGSAPERPDVEGWRGTLRVTGASATASVQLGHAARASDGFDRFDAEHLPAPATATLRAAIPHLDWKDHSARYMRDMRTPKKRDEWVIEIDATQPMKATVSWEMPLWVVNDSVLVDELTRKEIPVRLLANGYRIELAAGKRTLRWRLGQKSTAAVAPGRVP
ncbi:MAG TPA: S8 family serine peptidase [Thermoanaerobaculaceae bacterium]|nr:S8 family serine peptidase [Thermoanaerobaculaceae bacterium]